MTESLLEMRGIKKSFHGVRALSDVNLTVRPGEIHAIVGENGAGKSTLMKVLSGVYPHGDYEGDIRFQGQPCAFRGIADSEHRGIIIIHQELALVPLLSIAENIFLGNEQASWGVVNTTKTHLKTQALLKKVGLKEAPETLITHLGVGKQQLIEIAKALSKEVKLLILDEPTASLNETDSDALLELLLELKRSGIACILISHKLNEISKVADSITVLRDAPPWHRWIAVPVASAKTPSFAIWWAAKWPTVTHAANRTLVKPYLKSKTGVCTTKCTLSGKSSKALICMCAVVKWLASPA